VDRVAEKTRSLKHITVRGAVQGVGFRPFIFRLAEEEGLRGWVINTSSAVEIEVEGDGKALATFLKRIQLDAPPRARIESVVAREGTPKNYEIFEIRESRPDPGYQLISPDIATCGDCLRELFDPQDRRYRYPFINCTNCGPRYTIITEIPYDRPNTTMAAFTMCDLCRSEYENPRNRRFHAQPNACPVCGPMVWLEDGSGHVLPCDDPVRETVRLLHAGAVIAIKGLGGFHLACDATDEGAVKELRRRKVRPDKPLAVMVRDVAEAKRHCRVSQDERALLTSPEAPIVLLEWRHTSDITPLVAPGNRYMGVMVPYTPIHHVLLRDFRKPLVMTSGNISEEPIAKDNREARERLAGLADYFLFHNRDIYARYDDSVWRVAHGKREPMRRARSYAPYPIKLPFSTRPLLATGAQEKSAFCLARDCFAFLSQHIGDLDNLETLDHFIHTIEVYRRLFRIEPELVVHDLHPDYLSTRYAEGFKGVVRLAGIQHHHAHIASCMADNGLVEPVIGVAFDGSGYGPDGTVWGGEFLVGGYQGFERAGRLQHMPLPGGEISIRRPYRLAFAYLHILLGDVPELPFLSSLPSEERTVLLSQINHRINTPLTSSCGRLFDAVSALVNVCGTTTFEGQAAIALEMAARGTDDPDPYPVSVEKEDGLWIVGIQGLFQALVSDMLRGVRVPEISGRFHSTVAHAIRRVVSLLSKDTGIKDVVLSGGCFQNRLLVGLVLPLLRASGLRCFTHGQAPCNDGGIALGQAIMGQALMEGRPSPDSRESL
jgi:hydrogenase maturation protein HypF